MRRVGPPHRMGAQFLGPGSDLRTETGCSWRHNRFRSRQIAAVLVDTGTVCLVPALRLRFEHRWPRMQMTILLAIVPIEILANSQRLIFIGWLDWMAG
jgi:hypothetical protein